MRLALHVAAKDLRAHSFLLAAWGAALAADLALSTGWAHTLVARWPISYDLARLAASLAASLLGALVVVAVIHSDPTVGTTAFWLTRPIGRGTLLRAKLLIAALAIVVPALQQWTAVTMAGAGVTDGWRTAVETLFFQALMVLPLAALAAITADAGRYVLSLIAALAALPVVHAVVSATIPGRVFPWRPMAAMFTAAGLLSTLALLVLAHQLLTRKTRRSAALAVTSAILVVVAANAFTPAGRAPRRPARVDPGSAVPTDTRPEIQARVGPGGIGREALGTDRTNVLVDFEVAGLPPDTVAYPLAVRASWSFPEGPTVESKEIGFASGWWHDWRPSEPLLRRGIARLLGIDVVGSSDFRQRALSAGAGFDTAPLAANRHRPGTLALDVELLLLRLGAAGRVPLQPGRELWAAEHHLVVLRNRPDRSSPAVRVGLLRPTLMLRGAMWHDADNGLAVVLVNPSLHQASVARGGFPEGLYGGGLSHVRARILSLGLPPQIDDSWLAGAELGAVTIEPDGMIRRIVRIEGLRFGDLPLIEGRGL